MLTHARLLVRPRGDHVSTAGPVQHRAQVKRGSVKAKVTVRETGVFRRETETGSPVLSDQVVREGFLEEVTLKEALGFDECRV